jgi:hypothetical protein
LCGAHQRPPLCSPCRLKPLCKLLHMQVRGSESTGLS